MTTHLTARLAWHNDGWNGKICNNPAENTYCVGSHSYPGELIAEKRSLDWEQDNCGKSCAKLDRVPPCCYSINAFGLEEITAEAAPPEWWNDNTQIRQWIMPPASVCVWPYEAMYIGDVKTDERYDYEKRWANAKAYWSAVEPDKSLVFYYGNYSNPFSEDEAKHYALVGVSRIKSLGEELFYEGCSEKTRKNYAGGFVWQRTITSYYPDQGLRIPYHVYRDRPDILEKIVLFPENPRVCKYATRHMSDDDALGLVEGFLQSVKTLQEVGDKTEDWNLRTQWIEALIGELWQHRGLYPGMSAVLETLSLHGVIPFFKRQVSKGKEQDVIDAVFSFLQKKTDKIQGVNIDEGLVKGALRQWKLRLPEEQRMLMEVFPRFALTTQQIEKILSEKRDRNGITAELPEVADNPYILSEQYEGDDPDDLIPWGAIDRGMIPSPELGGEPLAGADDPTRLRALLVEGLRREQSHVFMPADQLIGYANRRLSILPEWKRFEFHDRYIEADEEELSEALQIRSEGERRFLYLKTVFEDERLLEKKLAWLVGGPDIELRSPVTESTWKGYLYDSTSPLAQKADSDYQIAIKKQIEACQRVFIRPLSILSGEAGSGKTTVIQALIKAIKKGHGKGTAVIALAPTGKAADRIREVLEKDETLGGQIEVATLHSFLAKRGWLNPNMTFKRRYGKQEEAYTTYILDEASMLDLALAACFFRSVKWASVQRLILVGDPNQLPPIGRGRIFADVIEYVRHHAPESIATLEVNLRQLLGRVTNGGTGIIDLAKCYISTEQEISKNEDHSTSAEIMLQRVQEGGIIDKDLRVVYWQDQQELNDLLIEEFKRDMTDDVRVRGKDPSEDFRDLWRQAFDFQPSYMQVLTPYRGEFYGVEELNRICQEKARGRRPEGNDVLGGVMLFDKVIQVYNRPPSRPIAAWNHETNQVQKIEVFNGQLGFALPHLFDKDNWKKPFFRLGRFRVKFDRRENFSVGYGSGLGKKCPAESVEENIELAYAVSVHKAQGSEFERVYVIVPKAKQTLLSTELFYTALTRAKRHCTLLVEQDISPLLGMRRPECAKLRRINTSLFEFKSVPDALLEIRGWMADGRIHQTLADVSVRSKSEVIIANMLYERDIPFVYEVPLYAPDGTFYLPDFTVKWRGTDYYWEHLGMLNRADYKAHWEKKRIWYEKYFPDKLIITEEGGELSKQTDKEINGFFA